MYGPAQSQILIINPLPSVGKANAMIVSYESQRITSGLRIGGVVIEATTLYANRGECNEKGGTYHSKNKVNWNLFRDQCKLHGHTKNICHGW